MSPTVATLTLASINTEYSLTIPVLRGLIINSRSGGTLRVAFQSGKVATPVDPYFTIPGGNDEPNTNPLKIEAPAGAAFQDVTVYIASSLVSQGAELIYW